MLRLRLFPTCTFIYERQIFDDQRELRTKILSVGSVTCLSLISSWDPFAKEKNDVRDDDRINNWIISSSIYRIFTILNPLCHLDDYIYISFNYLDNIKMPFSFTQNGIDEGKGISKHVVSFFWDLYSFIKQWITGHFCTKYQQSLKLYLHTATSFSKCWRALIIINIYGFGGEIERKYCVSKTLRMLIIVRKYL